MKVKHLYNYGSIYEISNGELVNVEIGGDGVKVNGKNLDEYKRNTKPSDTSVVKVDKPRTGGRTPEPLFKDRKGKIDEKMTQEKAASFMEYLRVHQIIGVSVDTSKENAVNKAFVVFYKQWMEEKAVMSQPNGNACFRFLQDNCGLTMDMGIKTYANFIRGLITDSDSL